MSEPSPLVAVPSIPQLTDGLLDRLSIDALIDLRRQLRYRDADVQAAIARRRRDEAASASASGSEIVLLPEAAQVLGTSEDTLYSKWPKLAFAFKDPLDGKIKFRRSGIAKYIASRTGRVG